MKKFVFFGFLFSLLGCAKFPSKGAIASESRVRFTLSVAGAIHQDYLYIIAIAAQSSLRPNLDTGPLPVLRFPWGPNGFVGGECTHYIIWKPNATPCFEVYQFTNSTLETQRFIGNPTIFESIKPGITKTIDFEIPLQLLAENTSLSAAQIQSLKVNFITQNMIPVADSDRLMGDSLGGGDLTKKQWILVPLNASTVYDNQFYGSIKPSGNVPDPNLRITDFSIEVIQPTGT